MQNAQTVVFGGSGLDRAAHLRGRDDVIAKALADGAPVLPVWRGKPLVAGAGRGAGCAGVPRHGSSRPGRGRGGAGFLGLDGAARFSSRPMCRPGFPTMWTRRRWAPSSTAACRRIRPRPTSGAGFRGAARDHGGAFAARRGACGDGARAPAMARHARPLRPLRRRQPARAGGMAAALRHLRRGAFPAHRPGRHHADHPWRQRAGRAGPPAGPSGCIRCWPGSWSRARPWRTPCAARFWRNRGCAWGPCATSPASPGRFRPP
jgi:hypothetical protein